MNNTQKFSILMAVAGFLSISEQVVADPESVALGNGVEIFGTGGIGLGDSTHVGGDFSVAIGFESTDDNRGGVFSVGSAELNRTLIHVEEGAVSATSTEAVNGGQLYDANVSIGVAQTTANQGVVNAATALVTAEQGFAAATEAHLAADVALGLAENSLQFGTEGMSVNLNNNAGAGTRLNNLSAGEVAATSLDAVNGAQLYEANQAIADNYTQVESNTASINQNAQTAGVAQTTAEQGFAAATEAQAAADVALGLAENSLQYGAEGMSVDLNNNEGAGTRLNNLSAGEVAATSLDAVNGTQLYETNQAVADNHTQIESNTVSINQNAQTINKIQGTISQFGGGAVGYNDEMTAIVLKENNGEGVYLENVAAGVVAADSMDAVNGSQLYETNMAIQSIHVDTQEVARQVALEGDRKTLREAKNYAASGIASAIAIPSVNMTGNDMQGVNVSLGYYDGETALGAAYARRIALPWVIGKHAKQTLDFGGSIAGNGDLGLKTGYNISW